MSSKLTAVAQAACSLVSGALLIAMLLHPRPGSAMPWIAGYLVVLFGAMSISGFWRGAA